MAIGEIASFARQLGSRPPEAGEAGLSHHAYRLLRAAEGFDTASIDRLLLELITAAQETSESYSTSL
ncbi:hypothetical protein BH23VER1_BH23VER1_33910 [soil metagenome]